MFAYNPDKQEKLYSKTYVIIAIACALLGGLGVGICSMLFATGEETYEIWQSYFSNAYIVILNLLPPIIISAIFYLVCNSAVWSFVITNILVMVPTFINYYKMAFRGDCFIATDMALAKESQKMLDSYPLFINGRIVGYLVSFAVCSALLAIFARGRLRIRWQRFVAAAALTLASLLLIPVYFSDRIYNVETYNEKIDLQWNDSQMYKSKGFVYPFLHSVKGLFPTPPAGYNEKEVKAQLDKYKYADIPSDKKVNIVCVMLEAYSDFSLFEELTFVNDVYGKYHELEDMGYSGTLVTDIYAGDTRISEREFLTGMPYARMDDFAAPVNSFVWYLRKNGYYTTGSHPLNAWFYNRENINKNLGFESYYFSENYYKERTGQDIVWDGTFFPMMLDIYKTRDKSKPYFSFSITYQGHGPYSDTVPQFEEPYVESDHVSEGDMNILNNYLNAQKGTTDYLYNYVKEMLATEEPLVIVLFGDHKPWMGNNGSVYEAYGINIDTSTEEGFLNYYSTRYLIIANDAAKEVCQNDFLGKGEPLSVSFLMNKVFELCGYKGDSYMQLASEIMNRKSVIHRADNFDSGDNLLYDQISYYYRKNYLY